MSEIVNFGQKETVIFTFGRFLTLFGQVEIQIEDLEMEDFRNQNLRIWEIQICRLKKLRFQILEIWRFGKLRL